MELDEETSTLASGALWQNVGSIAMKAVSFIYTIIIARLVSQEEVGLFYFALALVGVIGTFSDFGISQTVQRYVPFYLGKGDKISAGRVIFLTATLGAVMAALVSSATFFGSAFIASIFENPALGPVISLLAVYLAINQTVNISQSLLASLKLMRERAIGGNIQNASKLALTIGTVALLGPNATSLAWAFLLSFISGAAYLIFALVRALRGLNLPKISGTSWCAPMLREVMPFGLMMVGISTFGILITYTDRTMLGYMLKSDANVQIAIYSISTSLASLSHILAGSITIILLPVASGLAGGRDTKKLAKAAHTSIRWLLFSSVPIVAFLAAFAAPMLRLLYGAPYEPGALSLALFAAGYLLFFLGSVQATLIAAHRLVRLELAAFASGLAVNVLFNALLIPIFGISGAAFSSLMSFGAISAINHYYAVRQFKFQFPHSAWKNLFAGVLVFALLFALQSASYQMLTSVTIDLPFGEIGALVADKTIKLGLLLVFFAAGCLAYLLLLNSLRLLKPEDMGVFDKITSKLGIPESIRGRLSSAVFFSIRKEGSN